MVEFAAQPLPNVAGRPLVTTGFQLFLTQAGGAAQFRVPDPPQRCAVVFQEHDVHVVSESQGHCRSADPGGLVEPDGRNFFGGLADGFPLAVALDLDLEQFVLDVQIGAVGVEV